MQFWCVVILYTMFYSDVCLLLLPPDCWTIFKSNWDRLCIYTTCVCICLLSWFKVKWDSLSLFSGKLDLLFPSGKMCESASQRFTKWGFNYTKRDEFIPDVVPVAHPSSFINFLFLNPASHLLHRVCLNELSVSQPDPPGHNYSDIITSTYKIED